MIGRTATTECYCYKKGVVGMILHDKSYREKPNRISTQAYHTVTVIISFRIRHYIRKRGIHRGSERPLNPGESPRERPDRISTVERTIASRRPDSTSASWYISRRSSSVRDLTRQRATARPGRLEGINCSRPLNNHKRCSGSRYSRNQRWADASKCIVHPHA
jgi:hypothetical protein